MSLFYVINAADEQQPIAAANCEMIVDEHTDSLVPQPPCYLWRAADVVVVPQNAHNAVWRSKLVEALPQVRERVVICVA